WGGLLGMQKVGMAVWFLVVAFASIRHRALPRWLGWPAAVLAAVFLVLPDATIPVIISFLWVMVAGVTLAVQGRPQVNS
ncbi:MAG TPA: hypothetical protein VKY81_12550, partial [Natronosporangium sp.]|nr:hypothetical protein [Natronosporangium sp.]